MVNLAAIKAATRGLPGVSQGLLEEAFDDGTMGSERKSAVLTEESRKLTAYHEGGHALVALYSPGSTPIRKITIVPRGSSLGMVATMPHKDETSFSRKQMMARLAVALGGRAAEHLIFGDDNVTSGASSDFQNATSLAYKMVSMWGMSERAGMVYFDKETASEDAKRIVDEEVASLLQVC
jgi:ATP-dependent metalloprotease